MCLYYTSVVMKENLPISIKDSRGKDEKEAFRRKKWKLLNGEMMAEFRLGNPNSTNNEKTLTVYNGMSYDLPDLSLRTNKAVVEQNTGKKSYTVVDLSFQQSSDQVRIRHRAFVTHDSHYTDWPEDEGIEQPVYDPHFTETLYDIAEMDKKEILEAFRTVTPEDRVDFYGRKPHEAEEDARINKRIESIADGLLIHAQIYDAVRTDDDGKKFVIGETQDGQELIIEEAKNPELKDLYTNLYLEEDLYILDKNEQLLLHFPPFRKNRDTSEEEVIYTPAPPHDSLASPGKAKALLHGLQTMRIVY